MTRKQTIKNKELKRRIVDVSYRLGLSHIGSCLTAVDIIDEIYRIKKEGEKVVISNGHSHLAHVVVWMTHLQKDLGLAKDVQPSIEQCIKDFGIHCDRRAGCDVSTGSLGHGIGIAVGMALADRSKNVYCLLSDGECNEGSVWEAMRIRHELGLHNLKVYLNLNGWAAYQNAEQPMWCEDWEYQIRNTNMDDYPEYLQGQLAHYKVLNEAEYREVMEALK